ncbi:hypothetical protein S7711_01584 [Stachybotrys chartarum IBT 7711]|uniref:AB hydrolase-1 domain-containing protein n=1 Tax=Stachybotrys chartarum (strain CBS 109288 / IBT 7711) TaxID=1280523 RepID=A0A084BC53_STACB|nr:hypothetical protein S7711_01584 [Stachybotrys chartarum IBT 7711]
MDDLCQLKQKALQVSRGLKYTYYVHPAQPSKPTLALFHGWPDTARLYAGLINNHLVPHGYGVVAVDCLGYGGTSKPTDTKLYACKDMVVDIAEILDAEDLPRVISVGHDWGSVLCQRLYNHHPARVIGLITINVAYVPPTTEFDLDATNALTREMFGKAVYEYWYFFTAEDGASIMNQHLESVYTAAFGEPRTWLDTFCSPGYMRAYISEGRTQPTLPYATPEHKANFLERFSKDGGFEAPQNWYKAFTTSVQRESDKSIAEDAKKVKVPVLFWGGEQDFVCRPAMLKEPVDAGLLEDVKSVVREGGHWALLEKPDEFGTDILSWLDEKFA